MFCGVPCIVREGLNYGQRYHYVNEATGRFATESTLPSVLLEMVDDPPPAAAVRDYVMRHMSCESSTRQIAEAIGALAERRGLDFDGEIETKVNFLHGMRYFRPQAAESMRDDYAWLASIVREDRHGV